MPHSGGTTTAPPGNGPSRARYRRIMRFAARAMAQAWWFELVLPRIGLRGVSRLADASRGCRSSHADSTTSPSSSAGS